MYRVELYLRVRRACMVDGMSIREASCVFGLHRDTVRKMLAHVRIFEDDLNLPRKHRHTAKRIYERMERDLDALLPLPSRR